MGFEELRRPQSPEEENRRLKDLVADLSLNKQFLQDCPCKKRSEACPSVSDCESIV